MNQNNILDNFFNSHENSSRLVKIDQPKEFKTDRQYPDDIAAPPQRVEFKPPICSHFNKVLRFKTNDLEEKIFGYQCVQCGYRIGEYLTQGDVKSSGYTNTDSVMEFDRSILKEWKSHVEKMKHAHWEKQKNKFREWYHNYLTTERWKNIRQLVINRENNVCQGCRKSEIANVHHLNYDWIGYEFLFDLVGLCEPCHRRIHGIFNLSDKIDEATQWADVKTN